MVLLHIQLEYSKVCEWEVKWEITELRNKPSGNENFSKQKLLVVKGAIPGAKNSYVIVEK